MKNQEAFRESNMGIIWVPTYVGGGRGGHQPIDFHENIYKQVGDKSEDLVAATIGHQYILNLKKNWA